MKKVLILGAQEYKKTLLENLQEAGIVHIEPLVALKSSHLPMEDEIVNAERSIELLSKLKAKEGETSLQVEEVIAKVLGNEKKEEL